MQKTAKNLLRDGLPASTIIASPGKIPGLISISYVGLCGEDDLGNARLAAGMAGNFQAKKAV
jgi:hypothetical protein